MIKNVSEQKSTEYKEFPKERKIKHEIWVLAGKVHKLKVMEEWEGKYYLKEK